MPPVVPPVEVLVVVLPGTWQVLSLARHSRPAQQSALPLTPGRSHGP
jgi:hypothetical protein